MKYEEEFLMYAEQAIAAHSFADNWSIFITKEGYLKVYGHPSAAAIEEVKRINKDVLTSDKIIYENTDRPIC